MTIEFIHNGIWPIICKFDILFILINMKDDVCTYSLGSFLKLDRACKDFFSLRLVSPSMVLVST